MMSAAFQSLVFIAVVISVVVGCPGVYEPLIRGKCTRVTTSATHQDQQRKNCQWDGGELVSIHSAVENEAIRQRLHSPFVMIGLTCNETIRKFSWFDGTPFDYSNMSSNCADFNDIVVMRQSDGLWILTSSSNIFFGACELPGHNNIACNDYDQIENSQTCVAVRSNKASWRSAERLCQQESAHLVSIHDPDTNKYVANKAKELGLLDGLHIGLQSNASRKELAWTDGSNYTYTNYGRGFPNDIFGHCTALETHSHLGEWISNQCDYSALPYACGRLAFDIDNPLAEPGCPENPYFLTADTVYSPSYPGAPNRTECDYFFAVDEGKRVQVTFDDLDLNSCCDKVELYEGALGGTLITTLTGEPKPGRVFYTSSSNVMRLALTTKDGSFVRGFRAHFEARK